MLCKEEGSSPVSLQLLERRDMGLYIVATQTNLWRLRITTECYNRLQFIVYKSLCFLQIWHGYYLRLCQVLLKESVTLPLTYRVKFIEEDLQWLSRVSRLLCVGDE